MESPTNPGRITLDKAINDLSGKEQMLAHKSIKEVRDRNKKK